MQKNMSKSQVIPRCFLPSPRFIARVRPFMAVLLAAAIPAKATTNAPGAFPEDPQQSLERTCFQTGQAWSPAGNLRSDVSIVYGIDPKLPDRIKTWRDRGYRIHVMTGVSWGNYQDYLYGRFDGINHVDEAQTDRAGNKISHGGDVYYMCPGTNYGKFLCVGVQRALDAGAQAIHLEEPEFWVRGGYSEGFKREWKSFYNEDWQAPHSSVDAQWRASKLKYFLYRRALQQVFSYIQDYNKRTGSKVRCYVPTHSLLNYAHWRIVSPESSLASLDGCDGYIAQVWTGTSRTPNSYQGKVRERTFETAFLEYGAMQNLVRATGRTVWYLNDPIEDDPRHDWEDYRVNWESTLVASLLQPEVWQYEVAPWPERVFGGKYPAGPNAKPIPPLYATELQVVMNALNDLRQPDFAWDAGTAGIGLLVSDSLMFQRGDPNPGDPHLGNVYGLALPLLKRGIPVAPVQLESVAMPACLQNIRVLLLTYQGMKPLAPDVHSALAGWVRKGGVLVFCDDDSDPYNSVREWWNTGAMQYKTPREHLFETLDIADAARDGKPVRVGKGRLVWLRSNPIDIAGSEAGANSLVNTVRAVSSEAAMDWRETNHLLLRRGPYVIGAGLDESVPGAAKELSGRYVSLFDPGLRVQKKVTLAPGARCFLLDLDMSKEGGTRLLASACKALPKTSSAGEFSFTVEGVGNTSAIMLFRAPRAPLAATLDGQALEEVTFSAGESLLWLRFPNEPHPRQLVLKF